MIKVLIADDELLVRIGIKSTISWNEHGFEIVGDAADGAEALELFKSRHPDIVITDIKMPKLDGIALTKEIRKINSNTKIVILTCYDEFSYAKQAIELGASNYIIKATMQPEELLKTLNEIKQEIELRDDSKREIEELKHEFEKNKIYMVQEILKDAMNGEIELKDEMQQVINKKYGLEILYDYYYIICFGIDKPKSNIGKLDIKSQRLLTQSIYNICTTMIEKDVIGYVIEIAKDFFAVLLPTEAKELYSKDRVLVYAKRVINSVNQYTRVTISASISDRTYINEINNEYKNAKSAIKYRVFLDNGCIITPEIVKELKNEEEPKYDNSEEDIYYCIIRDKKDRIIHILNKCFECIKIGEKSYKLLKYMCNQFIFVLNRVSRESGINGLNEEFFSVDEVLLMGTKDDIHKWFENQFIMLADDIKKRNCNSDIDSIKQAIKYINENYMDDISLGDVAESVNISRTYFSYMFKKETGENYIDYLNKFRIQQSKLYFEKGNYKTYEVSEKVGFQDSSYFTKIFKKIEGIPPSEYIKLIKTM